MIPAFVQTLLSQGMTLLANAGLVKGKEWLKNATGVDLDAASMSGEDYVKLQQYQMDHEEDLIRLRQVDDRLGLEFYQATLADIQSARTMQVAAVQSESRIAREFVYWFALVWSLFAMSYIGAITFMDIPAENIRFADSVQGFILGTVVSTILTFFFGSSLSSKRKTEVMSKVLEKEESAK